MNYTALVERARTGDNEAIADLYNDTYKDAYFFALSESKNEHDALDILQNCYIEAFSKLDKLQEPEKFFVWFKSIIANRTIDYFRKKKPMFFADMSADDTSEDIDFVDDSASARMYSPEGIVDYTETQRLVQEILDELSDEQRTVALMYYFQEFSVKQIAEILNVNENTVKSRLNYARKKIKEEVLALEKKGTKLYGLAPIPFFVWLLLQFSQQPQLSTATAAQVLQNVQQGTAAAKGTAAASTSTKVAGAAAKAGLSGKAIIGIVAGVLVVGAVVGVLVGNAMGRSMNEQPVPAETTAVSDANSTEVANSDSVLDVVSSSEPEASTETTVDETSNPVASPLLGVWYYEEPKGDGQLVLLGETAYYDFGYYYSDYFSYAGNFSEDANTITFDLTGSHYGQVTTIHSVLDYSVDDDKLLLTLVSGDEIFTMRQPGDTITYSRGNNMTFVDSQVQSDLTLREIPAWAKGETGLRLRAGAGTDYDVLESIGEFNNIAVLGNSTSNPEWLYVAYHGTLGFVHSDYVTLS